MRLRKFVFTGIIITILAVFYVHQRVEIVKAGYGLQKNRKYLSYLVDQNSKLMYNLTKLESPRSLLTSLNGEEIEFASHRIRQGDSYLLTLADSHNSDASEGMIGRFLDLFTSSAEARSRE